MKTFPAWMLVKNMFEHELSGSPLDILFGSIFDKATVKMNYYYKRGVNDFLEAALKYISSTLDDEAAMLGIQLMQNQRNNILSRGRAMLDAFKSTPAFGLLRPKTRLIVIDDLVGIYVQPDFYDGENIYEVKTFDPRGVNYVKYQVRLFQLGYPGSKAILVGFDKATNKPIILTIDPINDMDKNEILRHALSYGLINGIDEEPRNHIIVKYSTKGST
ncbi:MAG: hypothetical protein ACP5NY_01820 [Thermocladium sp.]